MNAMLESTLKWPLRDLVGTFDDDVRTEDWKRHRFIDRFELYARSSRLTKAGVSIPMWPLIHAHSVWLK